MEGCGTEVREMKNNKKRRKDEKYMAKNLEPEGINHAANAVGDKIKGWKTYKKGDSSNSSQPANQREKENSAEYKKKQKTVRPYYGLMR